MIFFSLGEEQVLPSLLYLFGGDYVPLERGTWNGMLVRGGLSILKYHLENEMKWNGM